MDKAGATEVSACEIGGEKPTGERSQRTVFYKHQGDFKWSGVKDEPYKTKGSEWSSIIRRVLIGAHGESAKFHVRYFEISSNGNSSLELHKHEHVVICVKGKGIVRTGQRKQTMGFMDTVYISPNTVHQLSNPFNEPFGFLCIVNSRRDRPKILRE
jgi:quercetin dioxygenase-like cupin family protein